MGFGYALMRGQKGMEGYIRQTEGKREVSVRGAAPGAECALYAISENGGGLCGKARADQSGQCCLHASQPGRLFVAVAGQVRLWEGGDEDYLRACGFLRDAEESRPTPPAAEEPPLAAATAAQKETPEEKTGREPEKQDLSPEEEEAAKTVARKRDAGEPEYTLRPPGDGEPVDALPGRTGQ